MVITDTIREERRRYFRIDDVLGVSFRVLGKHEAEAFTRETSMQGGNVDFLSNFDNRIQTVLEACRIQSPLAAELIDLLNKKLNFVIRQLDIDTELIKHVAFETRSVNISACGIAFANENNIDIGSAIELNILLHPTELHVVVLGRVVACKEMDHESCSEDKPFYVRLDFSQINNNDQELLIQHIVRRQGDQIKQKRRQAAADFE